MSNKAIKLKNVSKTFNIVNHKSIFSRFSSLKSKELKSLTALDDISFEVEHGEIIGIIGVNGSGKSTLLRIIGGIYRPDSGSIIVNGSISPLLQLGVGFQNELDARENIIMSSLLMGHSKSFIESKVDEIIRYAELEKFLKLKLKHYSTGMKARLGFATSMLIDPDIFLIDEILSVGDKNFREKSYHSFQDLKQKKKTILFTTHNLRSLTDLADRVLLIQKGKIKKIGKPEEVIKEYMKLNSSR
jgi:ABC-type polysaccharide/polyol phosphate transport system ATPase subunit